MWKGLGLGRRGGVAAKTCAAIGGNLYQELRNIRNVEFKFGNEDYYETREKRESFDQSSVPKEE